MAPLEKYQTTIAFVADPGNRLFGAYLLSTFLIAVLVMGWKSKCRPSSWIKTFLALFPKSIWWHPSAKVDYLYMFVNSILLTFLKGTVFFSSLMATVEISNHLVNSLNITNTAPMSAEGSIVFTAILFTADDFTRYWFHRTMHKVPFLWPIHSLHHSAEVMTPFTYYRMHPIEVLTQSLRAAFTRGIVVTVFSLSTGMGMSIWELGGINGFIFLFNIVGANLRHSHVRFSYGKFLERIFVSPAQHQLHHSRDPRHFDKNFGACFSLWDWMFGSAAPAHDDKPSGYGFNASLSENANPHTSVLRAYFMPLRDIFYVFKKHAPYPALLDSKKRGG